MKTLMKFRTQSAEVKLAMTSAKDYDFLKGTYKVIETPIKKNSDWKEEITYYYFSEEAKKDMINRINFWIK